MTLAEFNQIEHNQVVIERVANSILEIMKTSNKETCSQLCAALDHLENANKMIDYDLNLAIELWCHHE